MFNFLKKKIKQVLAIPKKDISPELETTLLEAGVSLGVADNLISQTKEKDNKKKALKEALLKALKAGRLTIRKKPYVIMVAGINGTGKTTNLSKLAYKLLKQKKSVVVAASDTFRAAAIEQLEEHCKKLGIYLVKQRYGADPAAVAYDAISHAKSKGIDVVMIDTSGRMHVNSGLMKELEKIRRIAKPDLSLLVVDATTGNDAVEQAKAFNPLIDGFIISKADVDERGGAIISVSAETGKPIFFIGTGQGYKDLKTFSPEEVVKELGL